MPKLRIRPANPLRSSTWSSTSATPGLKFVIRLGFRFEWFWLLIRRPSPINRARLCMFCSKCIINFRDAEWRKGLGMLFFFPVYPEGGQTFRPGEFPSFMAPKPAFRLFPDRRFEQMTVPAGELAFRQPGGICVDRGKLGPVTAAAAF